MNSDKKELVARIVGTCYERLALQYKEVDAVLFETAKQLVEECGIKYAVALDMVPLINRKATEVHQLTLQKCINEAQKD